MLNIGIVAKELRPEVVISKKELGHLVNYLFNENLIYLGSTTTTPLTHKGVLEAERLIEADSSVGADSVERDARQSDPETEKENETIHKLWREGKSDIHIGPLVGLSPDGVKYRRQKHGWVGPSRKKKKP